MQQTVDGDLCSSASDKTIIFVTLKDTMKAKSYLSRDREQILRKNTLHQNEINLIHLSGYIFFDHKGYKGIFQQKMSIPCSAKYDGPASDDIMLWMII